MPDVRGGAEVILEAIAATVVCAALSVAGRSIVKSHRTAVDRAWRLRTSGRLALPAPESEQCRRRRELLDATGRSDPTSLPDCGTGEGARWDAARVGWIRDRDGEFVPLESVEVRRLR